MPENKELWEGVEVRIIGDAIQLSIKKQELFMRIEWFKDSAPKGKAEALRDRVRRIFSELKQEPQITE